MSPITRKPWSVPYYALIAEKESIESDPIDFDPIDQGNRGLSPILSEMDQVVKGHHSPSRSFEFPDLEVKEIRERLGVSQDKFALLVGVSKRTVENWEQGRRQPTGAARSLLKIVDADPKHALRALSA